MPDISISAGNSGISAGHACDWFLFLQAIYCDMMWHACPFKKQILNIISQLLQSDLFIPQMEVT